MKRYMRSSIAALLAVIIILTSYLPVFAVGGKSYSTSSNSGTRDEICTSLDGTGAEDYYTGIYVYDTLSDKSASQIKSDLKTLMTSTHKKITSYDDCHYEADKTDCENNNGKVLLIYTSYSATMGQWNGWNREHVWPQSLGGGNTKGGGADLHHIRPSDAVVNSTRGNDKYGNVDGGKAVNGKNPANGVLGGYSGGGYFEPLDNVKGDVARICLYVYVRWGSEWGADSITKVFQSVDVLLEWCELDPVDTWEMGRNEVVERIQGNRNVFIDYPEYAWLIFGREVPDDMTTPSGEAKEGNSGNQGGNTGNEGGNTGNDGGNTGNEGGNTGNEGGNTGDNSGNQGGNTNPGVVYNKVTELKTGDKIVIGAPKYNVLLSATKTSHYNVGIDYTETDFSRVSDAETFEVTKNADGSYGFKSLSGDILAMGNDYASLTVDGTNKNWVIEAKDGADGIFYLKNVGRGNYLDWYAEKSNWSTYNPTGGLNDQFEISFYLVSASTGDNTGNEGGNTGNEGGNTGNEGGNTGNEGGNTGDNSGNQGGTTPTECTHKNTEVKGAVSATCSSDGYTGDTYCKDCDKLLSQGVQIPSDTQHKFGEWTVNADGEYERECSDCGTKQYVTVESLLSSVGSDAEKILLILTFGVSDLNILDALSQ